MGSWSVEKLLEDLGNHLPVWRTNAREELLHRGEQVRSALEKAADDEPASLQTWALWTLGPLAARRYLNQ